MTCGSHQARGCGRYPQTPLLPRQIFGMWLCLYVILASKGRFPSDQCTASLACFRHQVYWWHQPVDVISPILCKGVHSFAIGIPKQCVESFGFGVLVTGESVNREWPPFPADVRKKGVACSPVVVIYKFTDFVCYDVRIPWNPGDVKLHVVVPACVVVLWSANAACCFPLLI